MPLSYYLLFYKHPMAPNYYKKYSGISNHLLFLYNPGILIIINISKIYASIFYILKFFKLFFFENSNNYIVKPFYCLKCFIYYFIIYFKRNIFSLISNQTWNIYLIKYNNMEKISRLSYFLCENILHPLPVKINIFTRC